MVESVFAQFLIPDLYLLILASISLFVLLAAFWLTQTKKGKGTFGEKVSSSFSKKLDPSEYKIVNDVIVKNDNHYSQIDHVVVSKYGIFVVETKVNKNAVYGNIRGKTWKQYVGSNKYEIKNPTRQNYGHIKSLETFLKDFDNLKMISIIAYSGFTKIKIYGEAKDVFVKNISQVPDLIKSYKTIAMSEEQKDEIFKRLCDFKKENKNLKKEHISYVKAR